MHFETQLWYFLLDMLAYLIMMTDTRLFKVFGVSILSEVVQETVEQMVGIASECVEGRCVIVEEIEASSGEARVE